MTLESKENEIIDDSLSKLVESRLNKYFTMHRHSNIPSGLYARTISAIEKSMIKVTLKYTLGNKAKAAAILGINRNTLYKKLKEFNLLSEEF